MSADAITTPENVAKAPAPAPGRSAHLALLLLVAINLFNYIDRQVLAAVEPYIRAHLFPESIQPGATDEMKAHAREMMGWLSSAFLLAYMFTAPVFGMLAERMSRWLLIGVGVIVWSIASGGSGWNWHENLVVGYWLLFLTRCLVGVGEAAYGPAAPAVIADLYPVKSRGQVMSFFYLAIPVGGALGYTFGDMVASSSLGWRWAFYLVVPPGLLLGLLCFLLRDPQKGGADPDAAGHRHIGLHDYLIFLRTPSYVLNTLGMTGMTFAIGGMAFWMPDYLIYREAGEGAVTIFGAITVGAGFLATIAGGLAGDWLRPRWSGSYFIVSGIAMLVGFPMVLLMIYTPFPMAWIWVFLAVFCLFFNTGPTNTILANVTHPALRASGFALNILVIHILGDVLSPPLMGYVAGYWNQDVSFVVVSVAILVGGLFWLAGARFLERDTALAPTRLN